MAKTTVEVIVDDTATAGPVPGESNARAVRNPDRQALSTLSPGLTSTAGSAASAAPVVADTGSPDAPLPAARPSKTPAKKVTKRTR